MSCQINVPPENLTLSWTAVVLDGKWIQPYRPGQGFLHKEMSELFGVVQK
jgi:hypothetical protein